MGTIAITASAGATAPGAPTIGTASVSGVSGTASVAFTAPASNGGATITSYTATSSPAGGTGTLSQAGSGTITVTGLTNGTAYTFTVTATNSVGTGTASGASNSVTPYTVPGAPTIGTAAVGGTSGTATVSYTAPASNGGSAITSYTATSSPAGGTGTLSQAGSGTITVTGLTNGTAYTFAVKATNAAGSGTASAASNSVTPYTVPGAPTITSITPGDSQLSVAFTTGTTGGSAITNYAYSINGGTSFTTVSPATTTSPIVITGLTNGTAYTVQIRAINAAGNGTASSSVSGTPASGVSDLATFTAATASTSQINLTATANAAANNIVVAYNTTGTFTGPSGTPPTAGSAFAGGTVAYNGTAGGLASLTGLTAGQTYYFKAFSYNGSSYSAGITANAPTSFNLPFVQNFNTIPPSWYYQTIVGSDAVSYAQSATHPTVASDYDGSSGYMVYYNSYAFTSGDQTRFFSPPITTSSSPVSVSFEWYQTSDYPSSNDTVTVEYSTDASTFTTVGTAIPRYNASNPGWVLETVPLPAGALSQSTVYVSFKFTSAYGDNCLLDHVTVLSPPTANTATVISATGFTANWTAVTGATGYQLDVATDSAFTSILSGYNNLSVSGTSQAVTGLTASMSYYYRVRALVNGSTSPNSSTITATTGSASSPNIAVSGTLSALTTTYGTASSTTSFTASGSNLTNDITVTAPTGFEISSGGSYASSLVLTQSGGTVAATTILVRLAAATGAGGYSGNVSLTSTGATTQTVATAASTVNPKALSVSGTTVATKVYDATTTASVTAGTLSGFVGSETVTATAAGAFPSANAGTQTVPVVYTLANGTNGGLAANYSLANGSATGTITAKALSITAPTVAAKVYDATTASGTVTVGTISGFVGTQTVTATATGTFTDSANIGTGKPVTIVYTLVNGTNGGLAANYSLANGSATGDDTARPVTISGLTGANKVYDGTTTATLSGTATLTGAVSGDSVSLAGTPTAVFASKTVGTAKAITVTNYTLAGASAGNYTLSQPAGLTANITAKTLTVSGATAQNKQYDGTTAATISGETLVGVANGDTVTVSGGGAFASSGVGTGIVVTSALTLGGADAANYTLTQPTGLTANITKADQTITFAALPAKTTADTIFTLTATASSGGTVTYVSSNTAVATVSGSTVTILAAGTTTITASQAGSTNYNAAPSVDQSLVVTAAPPLVAGWDFQTTTNGGTAAATSPNSPTVYAANLGTGTIYLNGTNGASTWSAATELTAFAGATVNVGVGFASSTTTPAALALLGGTSNSANGKAMILKFSMANRANLVVSYATQGTSTGFSSQAWSYSADGTNWTPAGTITPVPTSFTTETLATITGLDRSAVGYLRFIGTGAMSNSGNNRLDNIQLRADNVPGISTTGTLGALTTIYGTASSATSVTVSGANLTDSITATAPSGFEVSSDGTTFGGTAVFAQSSGAASGTLYVRLSASASAGSYSGNVALTSPNATTQNLPATGTVNPKTLSSSDITITQTNGTFSASSPGVSGFTLSYTGRSTTSYGPSATAPTAAGFYTVTATSSDPNYTGSKSQDYFIAGPVAVNDSITKPTNTSAIKIPVATLLANDSRVGSDGASHTDGLSITGLSAGAGCTVSQAGAFVFFTPTDAAVSEAFTYTLSDGTSSATGTVTVTTVGAPTPFTLQILGMSTATYDGTNTSIIIEFAGVPNQTYTIQYATSMTGPWITQGNDPTGTTGTFNVTFTASGDQTTAWNNQMFFRATH